MTVAKIDPPFNLKANRLVEMAPSDPDAAAEALLMAADFIRRGERLPGELATFLANGIESAMRNPARHDPHNADRGRALLVALHLKANNRRPKADGFAVHNYMASLMPPHEIMSQNAAARKAAKKYGIAASKAKTHYKEWNEKYKEFYVIGRASIADDPEWADGL